MGKENEYTVGVDSKDDGDLSFLAEFKRMDFKNIFFHNKCINWAFSILALISIGLRIKNIEMRITKDALYYFHSSIAQSMAAIIALVGTFAIFRYSFLASKIKSSKDSLKGKFERRDWVYNFGITDSSSWHDDEVLPKAEKYSKQERLPEPIHKEIENAIVDIKILQIYINDYLNYLRPPAISSFTTFILSIMLIPLSGILAASKMGPLLWVIFGFLIIITSLNIYKYFVKTATYEKRE